MVKVEGNEREALDQGELVGDLAALLNGLLLGLLELADVAILVLQGDLYFISMTGPVRGTPMEGLTLMAGILCGLKVEKVAVWYVLV